MVEKLFPKVERPSRAAGKGLGWFVDCPFSGDIYVTTAALQAAGLSAGIGARAVALRLGIARPKPYKKKILANPRVAARLLALEAFGEKALIVAGGDRLLAMDLVMKGGMFVPDRSLFDLVVGGDHDLALDFIADP
jgi:hypothetical protein